MGYEDLKRKVIQERYMIIRMLASWCRLGALEPWEGHSVSESPPSIPKHLLRPMTTGLPQGCSGPQLECAVGTEREEILGVMSHWSACLQKCALPH